jgi:tetratricopeptide (TPR) repeat protein
MTQSPTSPPIDPSIIARLLDSICCSPGFQRAPQLQRFLRYVVTHGISESAAALKESQIAIDVLHRDSSFDSQVDPIIRVEAGRLRLRLTEYYAGPGSHDDIVIEIPKGGYRPVFHFQTKRSDLPSGSVKVPTSAAHSLYVKGRYFWGKRTAEGIGKAFEYYHRALAVDPEFTLAFLGIADCHLVLATFEWESPALMFPRAKSAADSALATGTHLAEAHTTLACVKALYEGDWLGAETGFKRALEIDPDYANGWQWLGLCCCALGRFGEGLPALRIATERAPLSLMASTQLACGLYLARRYAEAENACSLVLEMDPHFWPARYFLGMILEQQGLFAQAVRELQQAEDLSGGNVLPVAALAHARARAGSPWDAMKILPKLQRQEPAHSSLWALALVYLALGERTRALELLSASIAERSPQTALFLSGEPRLDSLRAEPAFREMEKRLYGSAIRVMPSEMPR